MKIGSQKKDWYFKLPKVELHRHLEGSVRLQTIADLAKHHNLPLPQQMQQLREKILVEKPMQNLEEVLDKFWATQSIFVSPEAIERVTFEIIEEAWYENIRLLELRYCPSFITENHQLTYEDAFDAIQKAIQKARSKFDIGIALIAIASRAAGVETANEIFQHVKKHKNQFHAFDLADKEADSDLKNFSKLFHEIHKESIPITIHSGEEKGTEENIIFSIQELHAQRIGHGVQSAFHEKAFQCVKESGVTLELCPTSNWLTNAVPSVKDHPIKRLFDQGINISINSDDPGIMHIDLSHEYRVCGEQLHFTQADLIQITKHALQSSFVELDQKQYLQRKYFEF